MPVWLTEPDGHQRPALRTRSTYSDREHQEDHERGGRADEPADQRRQPVPDEGQERLGQAEELDIGVRIDEVGVAAEVAEQQQPGDA